MIFNNKEELIEQAIKDEACKSGIEFARSQSSLIDILKNISHDDRLWCLKKGYEQFDEHCDWSKLDGDNWRLLLEDLPQFSELCDWSKLSGWSWSRLLIYQPQFSEFCDWRILDEYDWINLLEVQPQFSEHCDWSR